MNELTPEAKKLIKKKASKNNKEPLHQSAYLIIAEETLLDLDILAAQQLYAIEWHMITEDQMPDETANCFWACFPICEPPYIGSMCDTGFDLDRYTHYMYLENDFFALPEPPKTDV